MSAMSGNQTTQRIIWTGWMVFGWIALIVLSGVTTLIALGSVSPIIPAGRWHDLVATLFVMVVWPLMTLALRFFVKHRLWVIFGSLP
jgi:hypothetical protein